MAQYIHGRLDAREIARLEKQAEFSAPRLLERFTAPPGAKVLDLATGVGAMAGQLLARYQGITLFGVDLSAFALQRAQSKHPGLLLTRGNGAALPFRDQSFDRVHCSWMLEHVPEPRRVLDEVYRVLKPGGVCQFTEVDNASFQVVPELPVVGEAMRLLNDAQIQGGGDPFIGRKLLGLLTHAGFLRVTVRPLEMTGDGKDLAFFTAFAEEFAEIFESLDEVVPPEVAPKLTAAAHALRGLPDVPGASMHYRGWSAQGVR